MTNEKMPMVWAKAVETIAMGETWWSVIFADAPEEWDERHCIASFTKGRAHAEAFADWLNGKHESELAAARAEANDLYVMLKQVRSRLCDPHVRRYLSGLDPIYERLETVLARYLLPAEMENHKS